MDTQPRNGVKKSKGRILLISDKKVNNTMKYSEFNILEESFKDAKRIFLKDTTNKKEVTYYIELFKELSSRNIISGDYKDIGYWVKQGWLPFKEFVDNNSSKFTKTDIKKRRAIRSRDQIVVEDSDNRTVVIPLTMNAACKWGKHTDWCISAVKEENDFFMYMAYDKMISIVFIIRDFDDKIHRYVSVYNMEYEKFEQFHRSEQKEENVDIKEFLDEINYHSDEEIDLSVIREWIAKHRTEIENAIDQLVEQKKSNIENNINDIDHLYKAKNLYLSNIVDFDWVKYILMNTDINILQKDWIDSFIRVKNYVRLEDGYPFSEVGEILDTVVDQLAKRDDLDDSSFNAISLVIDKNEKVEVEWFMRLLMRYAYHTGASDWASKLVKLGIASEAWFDQHFN